MRACIFNIQKFSLHDGPGIRTTVFFKGCPLRCAWCANPESLRPGFEVLWAEKLCQGCASCLAACPEAALSLADGKVTVDRQRCTGCGRCAAACPERALSVSGKEYTVDEVIAVCLQDKDFYADSDGGVTLSGGEVTMQHEFAAELLRRLRRLDIHTALETNGFARQDAFATLAGLADMLLFDVKHHDRQKHQAGTGVDNGLILKNLHYALVEGRDVLVRIPVIRGYNDGLGDARGFAAMLAELGVRRVQLLPFHQLGENKYGMLGMEYALRDRTPFAKEDLAEFREAMHAGGIEDVRL